MDVDQVRKTHNITDTIRRGQTRVEYCPTEHMVADFFTKPLQGASFTKFRNLSSFSGDDIPSESAQECVRACPNMVSKVPAVSDSRHGSAKQVGTQRQKRTSVEVTRKGTSILGKSSDTLSLSRKPLIAS